MADLENDISTINGTYQNQDVSSRKTGSIWSNLTNYRRFEHDSTFEIFNTTVKLTAQSKKRVLAQIYVDTSLVEQIEIKGKVRRKGKYFVGRPKVKYFGLPFIMWFDQRSIQFGRDQSGRLYIDCLQNGFLWILCFAGGNHDDFNYIYDLR